MAWNPSPEIAPLRDYSKQFDRPIVVVFSLERSGERFHVSTYGQNKKLCKVAGAFGHEMSKLIASGVLAPPLTEPDNQPAGYVWKLEKATPMEDGQ